METPLYNFFKKDKNQIRFISPNGQAIFQGHISKETEKAVAVYSVDRAARCLLSVWIPKSWFSKSTNQYAVRETENKDGKTIRIVDANIKGTWHTLKILENIVRKSFSNQKYKSQYNSAYLH